MRSVVVVGLLGPVLVGTLAGCGHYARSLAQREVVVTFGADATADQHRAARAACSHFAYAVPEPVPTSNLVATRLNDVRFRVDTASDAQLNQLYQCLIRQPGVVGVDVPSTGQ